jgi:hypothetical protein
MKGLTTVDMIVISALLAAAVTMTVAAWCACRRGGDMLEHFGDGKEPAVTAATNGDFESVLLSICGHQRAQAIRQDASLSSFLSTRFDALAAGDKKKEQFERLLVDTLGTCAATAVPTTTSPSQKPSSMASSTSITINLSSSSADAAVAAEKGTSCLRTQSRGDAPGLGVVRPNASITDKIFSTANVKDNSSNSTGDALAAVESQRRLETLEGACKQATAATQAAQRQAAGYGYTLDPSQKWSIPQKHPPVCLGANHSGNGYQPLIDQTSLIGTLIGDADASSIQMRNPNLPGVTPMK